MLLLSSSLTIIPILLFLTSLTYTALMLLSIMLFLSSSSTCIPTAIIYYYAIMLFLSSSYTCIPGLAISRNSMLVTIALAVAITAP